MNFNIVSVLGEIFTGQDTFSMNNNTTTTNPTINGFGMGNSSNNQPSSNYPIDQIPNNLDQDTMEERVTQVVNVKISV
jgi:hypothetical protein